MLRFKDMGVKGKLLSLVGVFVTGMLIFGAVAFTTLDTVEIGGNLSNTLETGGPILGDFSPATGSLQPAAFWANRVVSADSLEERREYMAKYEALEKSI